MVFRASMLADIGGMPTTTFMYGEEQLLGHRFSRSAQEVWYDPLSEVLHEDGCSAKQVWSDDETLLRTRIGLLAAMRETLTRPAFLVYNSLFMLATFVQALAGLGGRNRGYKPSIAWRFAKASAAAFVKNPAL